MLPLSHAAMVQVCLYSMLGCNPAATPEALKKAYKKQAMVHHPDKGGNAHFFNRLKQVLDILLDKHLREIYDSCGHDGSMIMKMLRRSWIFAIRNMLISRRRSHIYAISNMLTSSLIWSGWRWLQCSRWILVMRSSLIWQAARIILPANECCYGQGRQLSHH